MLGHGSLPWWQGLEQGHSEDNRKVPSHKTYSPVSLFCGRSKKLRGLPRPAVQRTSPLFFLSLLLKIVLLFSNSQERRGEGEACRPRAHVDTAKVL